LSGEATAAEETELTRLAGRPLTPSYAAPEQILGQPISTAADIYALGVLLFELLTGERPYRLAREALQRRAALDEAIVHVDVPPPSTVAQVPSLKRVLRGDLDAIVLKALTKAPEQRYETAAAFADDLERYLNRLPVRAQRASRTYRLRRFLARNRFAVGAVSAVIVALAVGLGIALWQAQVARSEAARATTIKDFVLSIIQQADPVASRQTREADVALLTTAEARIDKELEKQPELALQMRRAIGAAYRNRGEYVRAGAVLRKGIEQARTTLPPDNLELLGAYVQIAEERVIDTRSALDDLNAAIKTLRKLGPSAQSLVADALLARLRVVKMTSSVAQIREYADEAYRAARATGDAGRVLDAATEALEIHYIVLTPEDAAPVLAEAREYAAKDGRIEPNDPRWILATAFHGVAICKYGMAHPRVGQGTAAQGLQLAQDAAAAARTHHGPDSRVNEIAIFALGLAQWCAGGAKTALGSMRDAYAMAIKREPPGSINRLWRTIFLIKVLFDADERNEIEKVLRDTPIWDPTPGAISTSPIYPPSVMRLREATMRLGLGDTETAERLAEEALPLIEQEAGPFVVDDLFDVLAEALYENGKFARAESFALKALGDDEKARQAIFLSINRLLLLSHIRWELANYEGAIEAADRALKLLAENDTRRAWILARVNLRRGRALLGLARYPEAVEALAAADAYWQTRGGALEVSYWYGKALIASGDTKRGEAIVKAVLPKLAASQMPRDRALAVREGVKPEALAAGGRQ
jgi:tetratricopeptide (TPR) repeat protein